MAATAEALEKLQGYANKISDETEYHVSSNVGRASYETRLEQTVTKLRAKLREESTRVESLKTKTNDPSFDVPSEDPRLRLAQLNRLRAAYESLTQAEPHLPDAGSPLPALLAVRNVQQLNIEIKDSVQPTYQSLKKLRENLAQERADLSDAAILRDALQNRLSRLETQAAENVEQPPDELANTLIAAEQEKNKFYMQERKRLLRALKKFVEQTLAPMLAAEELGGPVAGSAADITEDALVAGFTAKGRAKKPQKTADDESRQMRIDQIWGQDDLEESEFEDSPRTESEAAAREMRDLMGELLNNVVEHGAHVYLQLERDSAAARFLVRAKVAMLHPKDARKIRLLDFGRELDD